MPNQKRDVDGEVWRVLLNGLKHTGAWVVGCHALVSGVGAADQGRKDGRRHGVSSRLSSSPP